jgi:Tol biopolymer transport system component
MSLSPGFRIGAYEIVGALGAGGMGEVYRGRDAKLGRDVAIKILPEQFATDRERVARFEREARTLASLNHPHIAQIYGLEQSGNTTALVMELVDGDDLSQRIAQGPIPLDDALTIARQIADALDAAHGQGIVHRDLKPANIKVKDDGTVKVLDFGLAKPGATGATGAAGATGATITSPAMSMPGVILGTAAYMAPEQAKGRPVDKRADIWAFGCVLYEMVTGRRAFAGEDISETIASILRSEPDWTGVPASVKPSLVSCLQKDPRQRLRDIGDVALLLDRAPAAVTPAAPASAPMATRVLAAVSIAALLVSGVMLWRARTNDSAGDAPVVRSTFRFQRGGSMQLGANQPSLAVSPDGKTIVYTALGPEGSMLWSYSIDAFDAKPLAGTGGGGIGTAPRNVFFSPDGRQIAFFQNNQLKRMPIAGGTVTVVTEAIFNYGGTWTDRDEIVFIASGSGAGSAGGLWIVPAAGGERRLIKDMFVSYPEALPGGRVVMATVDNPTARTASELNVVSIDVETGDVRPLFAGGTYPRYSATGHVLFLRNGALLATAIDVAARTVSDQAQVVVEDVFMNPAMASGNFAISAAGTLAYAPGTAEDFNRQMVLIDAKGARTPVSDDRRYFEWPQASPDGQRIAVTIPGWRDSTWLLDRGRGSLTELTTGDAQGVSPVWTPDGQRIAMASWDGKTTNLHWIAADGSGGLERLSTSRFLQRPNAWTPDGKTLIFEHRTSEGGDDLWTFELDGKKEKPLIATRFNESSAVLSPAGTLMAFTSDQSGRIEVYLTRYPSAENRIQVSTDQGRNPAWSPDGRRLYYRANNGAIMAVDVGAGSPPALSRPVEVVRMPVAPPTRGHFSVMPDGRLLMVDNESIGALTQELNIVVNWFAELRQKMSGK